MANLTARKSLDDLLKAAHGSELKRTLGPLNLVFLGIGAIIGTGIFVLPGTVAANYTGPAIVISLMIGAFACVCAGLCYAELASMIPIAGSAYAYSYVTLGEFFAWIIGWDLIIEYLFAAATVSVGWSGYVVSFMESAGIHLPVALKSAPISFDAATETFHVVPGGLINLPAVFVIVLVTALLVRGVQESASFNNVVVFIKTTVIILFIFAGISFVNTGNWVPMIPENTGKFGQFGWTGIIRGAAIIFFAYIGFDAVSTAAQEAKNPQRDLPIGILGSLFVCTILYIAVALVLTGIVPYKELNVAAPIALGIERTGITWLSPLIKIGAIAGLSSVILVMLLGQPRIFFTMSQDGLLPPAFSKVHPKFKTPYISTIITGGIAAILGALFPVDVLSKFVSLGTLFAFAMVCLAVIILRVREPETPRAFKAPFSPVLPALGMFSCLGCMVFVEPFAWIALVVWMVLGVIVYFLYGVKHSKVQAGQQ